MVEPALLGGDEHAFQRALRGGDLSGQARRRTGARAGQQRRTARPTAVETTNSRFPYPFDFSRRLMTYLVPRARGRVLAPMVGTRKSIGPVRRYFLRLSIGFRLQLATKSRPRPPHDGQPEPIGQTAGR